MPPRTPPAPASAMAPGMSGRGGAALLCLSALLAHGKCRGADLGMRMRRAPREGAQGGLEGTQGGLEKEEPPSYPTPPRAWTISRGSQPGGWGRSSSCFRPLSPLAGAEPRARGGDRTRLRERVGGRGRFSPLGVRKKGPNRKIWGRVHPRRSRGIREIL